MFKGYPFVFFLMASVSIGSKKILAQTGQDPPEKVYRYCYVVKPKEWYQHQEKLWKMEISKNPRIEEAWYSYFFAARYGWADIQGQTRTREALMDSIYHEMGKSIPNSWVYHYIHYYNYGTDFSRLEKAFQINPDCPDLYWEFIKEHTLKGRKDKRVEFCKKLYDSKDISTGLYNLNYNMLNSTEENSILFTNGDNDTYPAWVLQEAKGIRKDVLIITIPGTFFDRDYLKSILADKGVFANVDSLSKEDIASYLQGLVNLLRMSCPERSIHLAQTVSEPFYKEFKDVLVLTGIVLTYRDTPFDDSERHREILENRLRLDYIEHDWYADLHVSSPMLDRMNLIYVEPFLKLAESCHRQGDDSSSDAWKRLASLLEKKAGKVDFDKN